MPEPTKVLPSAAELQSSGARLFPPRRGDVPAAQKSTTEARPSAALPPPALTSTRAGPWTPSLPFGQPQGRRATGAAGILCRGIMRDVAHRPRTTFPVAASPFERITRRPCRGCDGAPRPGFSSRRNERYVRTTQLFDVVSLVRGSGAPRTRPRYPLRAAWATWALDERGAAADAFAMTPRESRPPPWNAPSIMVGSPHARPHHAARRGECRRARALSSRHHGRRAGPRSSADPALLRVGAVGPHIQNP